MTHGPVKRVRMALAVIGLSLPLAACAGGVDMSKVDIDRTTQTSSLGGASIAPDETRLSDTTTIRNAISAADVEALKGEPLAWANSDTGSRGTISSVSETNAAGALCRTFTVSRESYDGVGLYKGEACIADQGAWRMREFAPL